MNKNKVYKNKEELVAQLIKKTDIVLDVGFWGQGTKIHDKNWVHGLLLKNAKKVYGLDVDYDESKLNNKENYKKGNAEDFDFDVKFDIIFAGDLIEHLSNPGLFLDCCKKNLKNGGALILTTPNCFNLYNIAGKIMNFDPVVNDDHVCYFNYKTIKTILRKQKWKVEYVKFLYTLGCIYDESYKKKILNIFYFIFSKITSKYIETLVIIAKKDY